MSEAQPSIESEWVEPLLLRVRHLTRYVYHGPVIDSFNEARLQPVTDTSQDCLEFNLRIDPMTTNVRDYPDLHSNCVHYFDVPQPHSLLEVESTSLVQTHPDNRGLFLAVCSPATLKNKSAMENYFDFLNDSEYVSLGAEVWREAVDVLPNGPTDLWADSISIGRHIFNTFTYTPKFTTVNTKPTAVLASRRGVCQDFAHLMLGMCRTQGIPARYVSGYFYNANRTPDEIEASHAWVEVYLPDFGWKGFDPTHNRVPDTRYVKLAVGRDYGDIRPVSGTFRGSGTRDLIVEVQITRA